MNGRRATWPLVATVAGLVILVDQITKIWAVAALSDGAVDLFWTLRFRLIRNFGSAFGLGQGLGRWLGVLVVIIVVAVLWWMREVADRRILMLLGLVVGGAIGNLIDRVVRAEDGFLSGGVVDFIDFQWWPVFNVADIAVVVGAGLLALVGFTEGEPGVESSDPPAHGSGLDPDPDADDADGGSGSDD